ncbi:MAG: helix-turn-helix transcriptional regulator [Spirochaetes bacterium]|nr:helix-turn-helix transcriptional regulator [Spirochaetota bacterium]MBU1081247.1 helix-turn-helix transcriptional regulator [Spirochaetota bacterium]
MSILILWLDILAFAFLTAGFGAEFLAWLKKRESWRAYYLLTILGYAVVLFALSIAFFSNKYLSAIPAALPVFLGWVHTISSVLISFAFPGCVVRVAGMETGKIGKIMLWAPVSLTTVSVVIAAFLASTALAVTVNISFNAVMAAVAIAGALRVGGGKGRGDRRESLPFLILSAAAYSAFVALSALLVTGAIPRSDALASPFITGIFSLAWSAVILASAVRRALGNRAAPDGLGGAFFERFGLSPREADVARLLVAGRTNREIGEALYISTRTVESHVYNAYQKCGCRNKAEFVARAVGFGAADNGDGQVAGSRVAASGLEPR